MPTSQYHGSLCKTTKQDLVKQRNLSESQLRHIFGAAARVYTRRAAVQQVAATVGTQLQLAAAPGVQLAVLAVEEGLLRSYLQLL